MLLIGIGVGMGRDEIVLYLLGGYAALLAFLLVVVESRRIGAGLAIRFWSWLEGRRN